MESVLRFFTFDLNRLELMISQADGQEVQVISNTINTYILDPISKIFKNPQYVELLPKILRVLIGQF